MMHCYSQGDQEAFRIVILTLLLLHVEQVLLLENIANYSRNAIHTV